MTRKFFLMLLGGTMTMMVEAVLLMSDLLIAGLALGENAVAGVSLVTPLFSAATFFASLIALGIPILYTREMGSFNREGADRAFGSGLFASLILAAILFSAVLLSADAYLRFYRPSPEVLAQAEDYLFYMRWTILVLPLQCLMLSMVFADGDDLVPAIANIVQGLGNIAASWVLCRVMGIRGIGLASFLFMTVSVLILAVHLFRKSNTLRLRLYFSAGMLKEVLRLGLVDASSYLFVALLAAAVSRFLSVQYGSRYLVLGAVVTLSRELQLVFDGVGEALKPIVSIYLGEKSYDGVKSILRLSKKVSLAEAALVTAVMFLTAQHVPEILGIVEPDMAAAAAAGMRRLAFGSAFVSLLYLSSSYYLLLDRIGLSLAGCALRDFAAAVLMVPMGKAFGVGGFFTAQMLAPAAAWALFVIFLRRRYNREDVPFLLRKLEKESASCLFSFELNEEAIVATRDRIGETLRELGFHEKTRNRAMLLCEELFMLIREKNAGRRILAECALIVEGARIRMIERDTGVQCDLTDDDRAVTSLRSYVVSSVAQQIATRKIHLPGLSFNRNVFELEGELLRQRPQKQEKAL